jgi:hypothetical protein
VVKVRHLYKRSSAIGVRSTRYELDVSGCVDVSDEHAAIMLKGKNWRLVEKTPAPRPKATPPPAAPAHEDKPAEKRTELGKDELLELAQGLGLDVDGKMSKLKLAGEIRKARKERDSK